MRNRLKFRWYSKVYNKVCEVNSIYLNNEFVNFHLDDFNDITTKICDENGYLIQCTGQEDKNSQLIYEGDIIYKKGNKDHKNEKLNSVVIYDSMYCCFELADENGCHRMPANSQNLEVLGNIYENLRLQTCYKSIKEFES